MSIVSFPKVEPTWRISQANSTHGGLAIHPTARVHKCYCYEIYLSHIFSYVVGSAGSEDDIVSYGSSASPLGREGGSRRLVLPSKVVALEMNNLSEASEQEPAQAPGFKPMVVGIGASAGGLNHL